VREVGAGRGALAPPKGLVEGLCGAGVRAGWAGAGLAPRWAGGGLAGDGVIAGGLAAGVAVAVRFASVVAREERERFYGVEAEVLGIGAQKATRNNRRRDDLKVFSFKSSQAAPGYAGVAFRVFEGESSGLAGTNQKAPEFTHELPQVNDNRTRRHSLTVDAGTGGTRGGRRGPAAPAVVS